ncbi:hypothetical protein OAJ77_01745 [Rhodospirillales bacterium]|nr:hypothetical protein [Rhodospirillales bacterium]
MARVDAQAKRQDLYSVMYSDPAFELQLIELENARAELAQKRAELAITNAEAQRANKETLANMATFGIETRQANQE